jgi:hypothetical protein
LPSPPVPSTLVAASAWLGPKTKASQVHNGTRAKTVGNVNRIAYNLRECAHDICSNRIGVDLGCRLARESGHEILETLALDKDMSLEGLLCLDPIPCKDCLDNQVMLGQRIPEAVNGP